jgi:hypothetical protein
MDAILHTGEKFLAVGIGQALVDVTQLCKDAFSLFLGPLLFMGHEAETVGGQVHGYFLFVNHVVTHYIVFCGC